MPKRLQQVHDWLKKQLPGQPIALEPASADASFRRYYRLALADGTSRILMDAPPEHEDCRPFVHVAGLLRAAGVHVPRIDAADLDQGLLLLEDLGRTAYIDVLDADDADSAAPLFRDALAALLQWQRASRAGALPDYDEALLRRELALFPEWYVGRHLGRALSDAQQQALRGVEDQLVRCMLAQPQVFVHRDFMPRNLMVCADNPGVIDFQDAVLGPLAYDVISLFRDAFISWPEERVLDWSVRYWEQARAAGLPVPRDFTEFYRDLEWTGLQRHLKVLGIFARLHHRDGKPKYLADAPRFLGYAQPVARRYRELHPLARLLDDLENRTAQVGYTF